MVIVVVAVVVCVFFVFFVGLCFALLNSAYCHLQSCNRITDEERESWLLYFICLPVVLRLLDVCSSSSWPRGLAYDVRLWYNHYFWIKKERNICFSL